MQGGTIRRMCAGDTSTSISVCFGEFFGNVGGYPDVVVTFRVFFTHGNMKVLKALAGFTALTVSIPLGCAS